MSRKAAPG